nr:hypothetical protein [Tanacetum cinerariifolium]
DVLLKLTFKRHMTRWIGIFLRIILLGFHQKMVSWIIECVTSMLYSICVNGSLHGYFKGKWGLREGDSISPYLFTLVMEVLTLMLQRKVHQTDQFTYHRYCSKMKLVNLCFADDLFLFAYGDVGSASIIKEALDEFKFSKLSVKYFRVPFVSLRLMIRDCNELLDKVQIRIQDWKNKSLSIAAYETIPLESRIIGNTSLWFDTWDDFEPLAAQISPRDITRSGLSLQSKVEDVIHHGLWVWPQDLLVKYPFLNNYSTPIREDARDSLVWRNIMDLVPMWDVFDSLGMGKVYAGLTYYTPNVYDVIQSLMPIMKRHTTNSMVAKLVVTAATYYVWQERNWRLFKKGKRSPD